MSLTFCCCCLLLLTKSDITREPCQILLRMITTTQARVNEIGLNIEIFMTFWLELNASFSHKNGMMIFLYLLFSFSLLIFFYGVILNGHLTKLTRKIMWATVTQGWTFNSMIYMILHFVTPVQPCHILLTDIFCCFFWNYIILMS